MFAEIIFASLIAAGGPTALAQTPEPQPAVTRHADAAQGARLHLAADLGCPRGYTRRRGYDERCYRRHAGPYHNNPGHGYGRYDEDRYYDERPGRYSERSAPYYEDDPYRNEWNGPGERLRDRNGRPYREAEPGFEDDVPPYRRGGYDEPAPRYYERGFDDGRDRWRRGDDFRPYREGRDNSAVDYRSTSYDEPVYKKKDTGPMTITASRRQTAGFAAGSTV